MSKQANRTTVTLPDPLQEEVDHIAAETGVSISDLFRQGMIRVAKEMRETGGLRLLKLPEGNKPEMAA